MKSKLIRIVSLLLAFAMVFSMTVIAVADNEEETDSKNLNTIEYVRVGLYWGNNSLSKITLKSGSGFNIYDEDGNFLQYVSDTVLNLDVNSSLVAHKEGRIFMSASEDPDDRIVTIITDKSKQYRDGIYIYENSGLRVINYITLEHYVWGVVNREMSYNHDIEALKAQAVAARTYIMRQHYRRINTPKNELSGHFYYGFDVCATTDCQVYGAYASEHAKTTQACQETEGLIMTYDGEPIKAYFSAASGGGYTMSLYDAWGQDDEPYLKSVADPYTPEHNWEFTNTMEEIRTKIKNYYKKDIGSIQKFEVTKTNSFGCATQITVTGSTSTLVIPRSQIMAVFNLKSTFFAIGNDEYPTITKIEALAQSEELDVYYVMNSDGEAVPVATSTVYVYNGETVSQFALKESVSGNAPMYAKESEVCSDMIYWRGIGFGHGIGFSQTGAYAMAEQGFKYDAILSFYYDGIDIEAYTNVIGE